jgi:mono/diheme cytochrome c family protein
VRKLTPGKSAAELDYRPAGDPVRPRLDVLLLSKIGLTMKMIGSRWLGIIGVAAPMVVVFVGLVVSWRLFSRDPEVSAADIVPTPELVARGEYLARAADCAACHNAPGGRPFAGGLPFKLPFGTIYSTNITSDRETGIGSWSDDDFVRALHRGIAKDGTHLYPAFPYTSYSGISRDDAVAIKAYIFSLPAVHSAPPPDNLSFPFNQRWTMVFWNLAFLDEHRFRDTPGFSAEENKGAYLATALGHCGECHTPRNIAFAMDSGRQFAGAMIQRWQAYNITPDEKSGIGGWSNQQLADYLKTGHGNGRGSAAGPMGEAVANSLQYLTSTDIAALVSYLRKVKPVSSEPANPVDVSALRDAFADQPGPQEQNNTLGERIFAGNCAGCHLWNGQGRQTHYAALFGGPAVSDPDGTNLVQVLLDGADLRTVHPGIVMPSFGKGFSDAELAAVSNYVIDRFGGQAGRVSPEQLHQNRANKP